MLKDSDIYVTRDTKRIKMSAAADKEWASFSGDGNKWPRNGAVKTNYVKLFLDDSKMFGFPFRSLSTANVSKCRLILRAPLRSMEAGAHE